MPARQTEQAKAEKEKTAPSRGLKDFEKKLE